VGIAALTVAADSLARQSASIGVGKANIFPVDWGVRFDDWRGQDVIGSRRAPSGGPGMTALLASVALVAGK
jgi:hypothetical protein